MRRTWMWLLVGIVAVGLIAGSASAEEKKAKKKEEKVTIDQVPEAVKKTILKEAGANKIKEIEKVTAVGKTTYEAEWIVGGKEIEIEVAEDGTLLGKKEEDDEKGKEKAKPKK